MTQSKEEFVRQYMQRLCICGKTRSEHAHFVHGSELRVLAVTAPCIGFLDAIELELGGNPLDNPLLGPLVGT